MLFLASPALSSAQSVAKVTGSVEDSLGAPIPDVQIVAIGTSVLATTDAKGRFRLAELRPGSYLLRARRLGYEPLLVPVEIASDDELSIAIELRASATELAPVIIRKDGISSRLASTGFESRRAFSGAPPGQFLTRADLDRIRPIDLSQMLRRMSERASRCGDGVIFVDGVLLSKPIADAAPTNPATTVTMTSATTANITNNSFGRTLQELAKIGTPAPKPQGIDLIPVSQIEGMEVYSSPAQIPNEYRAAFREARCVILLWTK